MAFGADLKIRRPWEPGDWSRPGGVFPHAAIQNLTRDSYLAARNSLMLLYDDVVTRLAAGDAIPAETCQEFARLLRLLLEPPLKPCYRGRAPRFFERFLDTGQSTE